VERGLIIKIRETGGVARLDFISFARVFGAHLSEVAATEYMAMRACFISADQRRVPEEKAA
jgi:hypothetical protein